MIALEPASSSEAALSIALTALRATVRVDLAEFRREVGWRLPSALESVSAADIRQHLGPFLEDTFRNWAERESREVQEALAVIAERALTARPRDQENERESLNGPDSRLTRPILDVSTFAIDASVVAALALGVGTLFANVAVGGLFLLAAPTLATFGRGRGERALRKHAAESALKSVDDAVAKLGAELERVIDDFSLGIVD
ncbi:MAG TPA: hypothetical protein VGF76_05150 [Polyangiaceae bacterium]